MSTGFRLFLLTICAFGAIAVYRLRTPELARWLRQTPSGRADPAGGPLVSPVDRILEPDVSLAMIRLSENPGPRPPAVEAGDMEPAAAPLSGEEILEGADLPVVEVAVEEDPALEEDLAGPGEPLPLEEAGGDEAPSPPPEDPPGRGEPARPPAALLSRRLA